MIFTSDGVGLIGSLNLKEGTKPKPNETETENENETETETETENETKRNRVSHSSGNKVTKLMWSPILWIGA